MKNNSRIMAALLVTGLTLVFLTSPGLTEEEYRLTFDQFEQAKAFYDDPRPILKEWPWKRILPAEVYRKLTYDKTAMKNGWAELVGFRAPELVNRIAPEIKPGKYSCADKEKYPGLKELMWPTMYERFTPGGPPYPGNFSAFEVVPTKQYYPAMPIIAATMKHLDQAKLDDQGYLIENTYTAGLPFPQPGGKHKPQQIVYNWVKGYLSLENLYMLQQLKGYTAGLKEDFDSKAVYWALRLQARAYMAPDGWYDPRSQANGEVKAFAMQYLTPRDLYGNVITATMYQGWNDYDQFMIYLAALRRVRKLSGTDTQDAVAGMDVIYEDSGMWSQKITPEKHPYRYNIIADREYLVPAYTEDGAEYLGKHGLEWHNLKFERRPCYVLEMTQLDKSYVYGKRIAYIDKETFHILEIDNYDQKGRLYRTQTTIWAWHPEFGSYGMWQTLLIDHLDQHATWGMVYGHPATWINRKHVGMRQLIETGK
ncbi:MAG: outer membrane lipoprotein-sorting protein [Deltaproteobacteria bacterium]|nr:outer membrane lipoprotein-sorting protein [Deltaproteobacteria bacterium]